MLIESIASALCPGRKPRWTDDEIDEAIEINAARQALQARIERRPTCPRCGSPVLARDIEPLHDDRGWCGTCAADWLDRSIIQPLVDRLGPKAARRTLRRLVRDVRALT